MQLSEILKEHQAKQAKLREINDQNRKAALAATESVVNLMADSIGDSVADVFVAEKKLEKETKGLQTNTAHFAKQTHQWLDMMKQFNTNLKVSSEKLQIVLEECIASKMRPRPCFSH